jgi:hypothetical protein
LSLFSLTTKIVVKGETMHMKTIAIMATVVATSLMFGCGDKEEDTGDTSGEVADESVDEEGEE